MTKKQLIDSPSKRKFLGTALTTGAALAIGGAGILVPNEAEASFQNWNILPPGIRNWAKTGASLALPHC